MTVFADTSALFVVLDRSHADHPAASRVWSGLLADNTLLVTSSYVLVELSALLQRRLGMDAWRDFETQVTPLLQVIWIDEQGHQAGVRAALSAGRRLSLVDCVSFQVMRQTGVRTAFCFDNHFREQGFDVLP